MLDFEEKWQQWHNPNGRIMTCGHRGDANIYYPENSLEGNLSIILAGVDMIEVDVWTTKDGQLIAMHDPTVTRTTNATELRSAGEDWLPESDEISQWTLEQIRRLRLKTWRGVQTDYMVPTLRELIQVCKNRCFLTLDKIHGFRWEAVYELIKELEAYRTVLIPYNYPLDRVYEIEKQVRRETGYTLPFMTGAAHAGGIWSIPLLYEGSFRLKENGMAPVLRGGDHRKHEMDRLRPVMDDLKKDHRLWVYSGGLGKQEGLGTRELFDETLEDMLSMGYDFIMANKIYDLLDVVKQRHFL